MFFDFMNPVLASAVTGQVEAWIGFFLLVAFLMFLDIKVLHKKAHAIEFKEAVGWSVFWVSIGLAVSIPIYFLYQHHYEPGLKAQDLAQAARTGAQITHAMGYTTGKEAVLSYLTGYIVEEALSVDNLFVFLMLFTFFKVDPKHQHRVLFWGIIGAMAMRMVFIFAGVALVNRFTWVMFVFGAFLLFTGIKMAVKSQQDVHPQDNRMLKLLRKFMPVTRDYHGSKFLVKIDGRTWATPMLVVLVVIETTDLAFAVDSIPAILGITHDPFIVFSSNIFAILGLRALYFALAGLIEIFHFLHYGLAAILVFIGLKMISETSLHYDMPGIHVDTWVSLLTIGVVLALTVAASLAFPKTKPT